MKHKQNAAVPPAKSNDIVTASEHGNLHAMSIDGMIVAAL